MGSGLPLTLNNLEQGSTVDLTPFLISDIIEKASEYDGNAQWIIVDNEPPQIADKFIAVRFTRNKDNPPYGLIDDETD